MPASGPQSMGERWSALLAKRKKRKAERQQRKRPAESQHCRNSTPDALEAGNELLGSSQRTAHSAEVRHIAANIRRYRSSSAIASPNLGPHFTTPYRPHRTLPANHSTKRTSPAQAVNSGPRPEHCSAPSNNALPDTPGAAHAPQPAPIDTLHITMRASSPQIEQIASQTSPAPIKAAVSLLRLLQSRGARLQAQLDALPTIMAKQQTTGTKPDMHATPSDKVCLTGRVRALEEMEALVAEHWYEVLVLEYALRDVVDEESGTLERYVEQVRGELVELVREYDEKIWGVMVKGWPEAAQKTVRETKGFPKE